VEGGGDGAKMNSNSSHTFILQKFYFHFLIASETQHSVESFSREVFELPDTSRWLAGEWVDG
jgi:hypothetical protein